MTVQAVVPDGPGLDQVTVDFTPKRGVRVEGKVTDKVTGKPVRGQLLMYYTYIDNPNLTDYPGFKDARGPAPTVMVQTKADGSYRLVALPGPGLIAVMAGEQRYLRATERQDEYGAKGIKGLAENLITQPVGLGLATNYTAFAPIDPAKGTASVKRDVTLDPS
jgi:hypothetical protein